MRHFNPTRECSKHISEFERNQEWLEKIFKKLLKTDKDQFAGVDETIELVIDTGATKTVILDNENRHATYALYVRMKNLIVK